MQGHKITDLQKIYFSQQFEIVRFPELFNSIHLKDIAHNILSKFSPKPKDNNPNYCGLCLHSQKFDAEDSFYEDLNAGNYQSRSAENLNVIGQEFQFIYDKLEQVKLKRGRLLIAKPNILMVRHADGPFNATLHVPIETNEKCEIIVGKSRYHLPADGSAYLVNATLPHQVINKGETDRVHLVFIINPSSFYDWTQAELATFSAAQFNLREENRDVKIVELSTNGEFTAEWTVYFGNNKSRFTYLEECQNFTNYDIYQQIESKYIESGKLKSRSGRYLMSLERALRIDYQFRDSESVKAFFSELERSEFGNQVFRLKSGYSTRLVLRI